MQFLKSIPYSVWCLLCSLPLFFIGIESTHDWGDDFAQYLVEAQNIAKANPLYESKYVFNPINAEYAPRAYPPGYPLLQAPLIKLFGINLKVLFLELSVLLGITLFAGFSFFNRFFSKRSALALAVLVCYCPQVLALKYHLLSDLPLMCFMTLYAWRRSLPQQGNSNSIYLALISCFAFLIRSQAIIILVAECCVLLYTILVQRKKYAELKSSIYIVVNTVLLLMLLQVTLLRQLPGTLQFYLQLFSLRDASILDTLQKNSVYAYELLQSFFVLRSNSEFVLRFCYYAGHLSIVLCIAGILLSRSSNNGIYALILLFNYLIIIFISVQQGVRYLLPILPFFVLFVALALRKMYLHFSLTKLSVPLLAVSAAYCLFNYASSLTTPYDTSHSPFTGADSITFTYLKKHLPQTAVVCSTKPRAIALLAGVKATTLSYTSAPADNKRNFDSLQVNYFLCRKDLDWDIIERYLRSSGDLYDTLEIASTYTLYTKR